MGIGIGNSKASNTVVNNYYGGNQSGQMGQMGQQGQGDPMQQMIANVAANDAANGRRPVPAAATTTTEWSAGRWNGSYAGNRRKSGYERNAGYQSYEYVKQHDGRHDGQHDGRHDGQHDG
jgi:hypothetical protein